MINSEFESVEKVDYPSLDSARSAAITTATRVAAESAVEGHYSVAVEVQIHEGERMVARHVVTLSVSELITGEQPPSA
jgi:hypothetical protein